MSAEAARDLLVAFLAGEATRLEVARRVDLWASTEHLDDDPGPDGLLDALVELFPLGLHGAPERESVELVVCALDLEDADAVVVLALSTRRPLLAALLEPARTGVVPDAILRPGERILLGTSGGRSALGALLAGDVGPLGEWLDRTVLDPAAFLGTTWDVPLLDVGGLSGLVRRLVHDTELLPPGPARAMVAGEWVGELACDSLPDESTFPEVVRAIGELLLESDAPILLWHAVQELALVAEDDPALAERVLARCLPVSETEHGRCPATAAAPLLGELPVDDAAGLLDRLAPSLGPISWDAVARRFLSRDLAERWIDWRPHVQRWASEPDPVRADAVQAAIVLAGTPEREALGWFDHSEREAR